MKISIVAFAWHLFFGLLLYPGILLAQEGRAIQIATSIKPLTLIVHQLLGDQAEINQLYPGSQDPHHQYLRFSQVGAVKKADIVLWFGPQLESGLGKLMASQSNILELGPLIPASEGNAVLKGDLHVWLNPRNGYLVASEIVRELIPMFPEREFALQRRLLHFKADMDSLNAYVSDYLLPEIPIVFIAEHKAYGHFSQSFGLLQAGALHRADGTKISPREMSQLQQLKGIDCVVFEPGFSSGKAKKLAQKWQAKALVIDPLGAQIRTSASGYSDLIEAVAQQFSQCKAKDNNS